MNEPAVSPAIIEIPRFKTPNGNPTCRRGPGENQECVFLGHSHYGTVPTCMFGEQQILRTGVEGFIVPGVQCKLWQTARNN